MALGRLASAVAFAAWAAVCLLVALKDSFLNAASFTHCGAVSALPSEAAPPPHQRCRHASVRIHPVSTDVETEVFSRLVSGSLHAALSARSEHGVGIRVQPLGTPVFLHPGHGALREVLARGQSGAEEGGGRCLSRDVYDGVCRLVSDAVGTGARATAQDSSIPVIVLPVSSGANGTSGASDQPRVLPLDCPTAPVILALVRGTLAAQQQGSLADGVAIALQRMAGIPASRSGSAAHGQSDAGSLHLSVAVALASASDTGTAADDAAVASRLRAVVSSELRSLSAELSQFLAAQLPHMTAHIQFEGIVEPRFEHDADRSGSQLVDSAASPLFRPEQFTVFRNELHQLSFGLDESIAKEVFHLFKDISDGIMTTHDSLRPLAFVWKSASSYGPCVPPFGLFVDSERCACEPEAQQAVTGQTLADVSPCSVDDSLVCTCGSTPDRRNTTVFACMLPSGARALAAHSLSMHTAAAQLLLVMPDPDLSPLFFVRAGSKQVSTRLDTVSDSSRTRLDVLHVHSQQTDSSLRDQVRAAVTNYAMLLFGSSYVTDEANEATRATELSQRADVLEQCVHSDGGKEPSSVTASVHAEGAVIECSTSGDGNVRTSAHPMPEAAHTAVLHWLPPCSSSGLHLASWDQRRLQLAAYSGFAPVARQSLRAVCASFSHPDLEGRVTVPAHVDRALGQALEALSEAHERLQQQYTHNGSCVAESTTALRDAVTAAHRAAMLAWSAQRDPGVSVSSFLPFAHIAALYAPPWAPVVLPLLIALLKALTDLRSRKRKGGGGLSSHKVAGENVHTSAPGPLHEPSPSSASSCDSSGTPLPSPSSARHEYAIRGGHALSIRLLRPRDAPRLCELYSEGQAAHMLDEASREVHGAWLRHVLATDYADLPGHYNCGFGAPAPGVDAAKWRRSGFWVASLPRAAVDALTREVHAEEEEGGRMQGGGSGGPSPTDGLVVIPTAHLPAPLTTGPRVASSQREGGNAATVDEDPEEVIVGCVACAPFVPERNPDGAGYNTRVPLELPRDGSPASTRVGELLRMCVDGAVRRCGVASALVAHLEHWAAAGGSQGPPFDRVALSTLLTMRSAVALYTANGYAVVGPDKGVPEQFAGHPIRVVELLKALNPGPR